MNRPGRRTGDRPLRPWALALATVAALAGCGLLRTPPLGLAAAAAGNSQGQGLLRSTEVHSGLATATPLAMQNLIRITDGGCCTRPAWSADSQQVLFIDALGPGRGAGLVAVPAEGGKREVIWPTPAQMSPDGRFVVEPAGERVRITRLADGRRVYLATQGREAKLSPDGAWVAWDVVSEGISHPDVREHAVWIAEGTGARPHQLSLVTGGGIVGWKDDGAALIVVGRIPGNGPEGIWTLPLDGSKPQLLHPVQRPRDVLLSPHGGWLAFYVGFSGDAGKNGLWIMRTDGTSVSKVTPFGAYRWRDEGHLVLIPYDAASAPALWEVDAVAGTATRITDPAHTSLPIANNDWQISPDGRRMVFQSWSDRNLWVLTLPD